MADSLERIPAGCGRRTRRAAQSLGRPPDPEAREQRCPSVKIYGTSYIHADRASVKRRAHAAYTRRKLLAAQDMDGIRRRRPPPGTAPISAAGDRSSRAAARHAPERTGRHAQARPAVSMQTQRLPVSVQTPLLPASVRAQRFPASEQGRSGPSCPRLSARGSRRPGPKACFAGFSAGNAGWKRLLFWAASR